MKENTSNQRATAMREIYTDTASLSGATQALIEKEPALRAEYELARRMEDSVARLRSRPVPGRLRSMVFGALYQPAYRVWHLLAATLLLGVAPLFLAHSFRNLPGLGSGWIASMFAIYGVMIFALMMPLAFQIFRENTDRLEHFKDSFDDYIEHGLRALRLR